ncbi:MAG: dihydroorotase [Alphaproteobacteria bacterium]|jgi:dihydroorotase|nr:dihydroorotase [Alphaproteobacteria bacterium]MBT5828368.1 dihydroorotase [Alphaproteobacteria bacterium]
MPKFNKPHNLDNAKKILSNCLIIDPASKYEQKGEVIIDSGKIIDFGADLLSKYNQKGEFQIIDCKGNIVCPGLIDIQVHFRDPGQTHKEDLISGSKAAIAGGVTSVVCQPNTSPVIDNEMTLEYLTYKAKQEAYCNVFTYAAITKAMAGETLAELAILAQSELVVGFTDDGLPVMNANIMRRALEYAKSLNMVVAQHAEDLNISNKGCINEGAISEKLGVSGIPNVSESVIVARDIDLVRLTGGKYHVLHVSARESLPYIVAAKKENLPVTAEVSPHHFSLTDAAILEHDTDAKMNPPLRSELDRTALIEALKDGTIDAIATDHAPHDFDSKNKSLQQAAFGIVGLETLLPLSLELYHNKHLSLHDLLAKLTCNPADIINIDRGRIKKGAIADLTVIDINAEFTINKNDFYSKSKNTPFNGRKVKGRAVKTFLSGHLVFEL